jgi:hypothetical protein
VLARAGLFTTGPAITGLDSTGLIGVTGQAITGPARAGPASTGLASSGLASSELPGTRHTAARAGPGMVRVTTAEDIQRVNRPQRKKVLRADFIAAQSH